MARLLRFDVSNGKVVGFAERGDTNKSLGRADVLINPDLSATTSRNFSDWLVENISTDRDGQGTGTIREMTDLEKQALVASEKAALRADADAGKLEPNRAIIALYKTIRASNPGLANAWLAQYKTDIKV